MLAKRFFLVSAGLLCLAIAYHFGAANAIAKPPGSLADVALMTGVLNDGETIPLPVFSDGSTAFESECRWTVSASRTEHLGLPESDVCYTEGRVVHVSECLIENGNCTAPRPGKANYMIVAVRHA